MAAFWQGSTHVTIAVAAAAAAVCQHQSATQSSQGRAACHMVDRTQNNGQWRCPCCPPQTDMFTPRSPVLRHLQQKCCKHSWQPGVPVAPRQWDRAAWAAPRQDLLSQSCRAGLAARCYAAMAQSSKAHPLPGRVSHLLNFFDAILVLLVCLVVCCRWVQRCQMQGCMEVEMMDKLCISAGAQCNHFKEFQTAPVHAAPV